MRDRLPDPERSYRERTTGSAPAREAIPEPEVNEDERRHERDDGHQGRASDYELESVHGV